MMMRLLVSMLIAAIGSSLAAERVVKVDIDGAEHDFILSEKSDEQILGDANRFCRERGSSTPRNAGWK